MPISDQELSVFKIVTTDSNEILIGEVVYLQTGLFGTPKGLLLVLTNTPQYLKRLKTANGLREII